jgi:hypothetical protein
MASWVAYEPPLSDFGSMNSGIEMATYSFHPEDRPEGQSPSFDYDAIELPYSRFPFSDVDGFELAFYQYVAPGLPAPSEDVGYWG